jgi:hypothetical protein
MLPWVQLPDIWLGIMFADPAILGAAARSDRLRSSERGVESYRNIFDRRVKPRGVASVETSFRHILRTAIYRLLP